ncbi:MAG: ribonuclease HI family protein [Candidatus Sungbacteria bacterium]|nr:ribonuclease HI family protein [Candidatus Sungbacteria bacterium]
MAKPKEKIIIYTDGGSRGNPGPAAIGVAIYDKAGHMLKSYGKAVGIATNNEAEYGAVIFALEKVRALFGKEKIKEMQCEVRMDSELVMRQLNGKYKIEQEHLFPLFIKVWNLRVDFGRLAFAHVPREQNREADRLVNQALDSEQHALFFTR